MEKNGSGVETPSFFKASNYSGIEYFRNRDTSLYMKSCGMHRCLPGYTYPHNAREGYHLHVVLSGRGILQVHGNEYHIHKGQLFLLKEHEEVFYQADQEDPWYYVWVTYVGTNAEKYMQYAGFTEGVYVQDCNIDPADFSSVIRDILEHPHLNISSEVYRMSQAIRFLSLAIESWEKSEDGSRKKGDMTADDYVNYAARYIRENCANIRISDVADYIGINRTYLTAIFREKIHMSPQEFLMQVRMDRSRNLLLNTDAPIYAVASEVGYSDQMAFSKIFRKKTGMSPEQYRKKHRDEHTIQ